MRKDLKEQLDPTQPALLVTYGNTSRKHRTLDSDLVLIGRAPFCDLHLNSCDVSPIHCVIARTDAGWRIRDCTGRSATRVNGQVIHDELLTNGDAIQIGAFTFEAHLPLVAGPGVALPAPPPAGPSPFPFLDKLRRSRQRLVKRALHLRQRLRQRVDAQHRRAEELDRWQADLNAHVEQLQHRLHEYDIRRAELEQAERQLALEREKFDRDTECHQQRLDQFDRQQVQKLKLGEAALRARHDELDERQRQLDLDATVHDQKCREAREREHLLEQRAQELDQFAAHLRKQRQEPPAPAVNVVSLAATGEATELLTTLRQLCRDLAASRHEELEQVHQTKRQLEQALQQQQAQRQELESRLQDRTVTLQQELEAVHQQVSSLRREVAEKATQIERLTERKGENGLDPDSYEAELNHFRQQIEEDRYQLDEQISYLRQRNSDLEQVVRETELQLARERAQLARERAELIRLREDIRSVQERPQREPTLRDRLLTRTSSS